MRKGTPAELIVWLKAQPADKVYEITEPKPRRSLSQNDFYWKIVTLIGDKMRMDKYEVHNRLMRMHGRDFDLMVLGKRMYSYFPDTDETEKKMLAAQTFHFRPTSKIRGKDGFRAWVMLQPSHDMNTEQMAVLIDGALQVAAEQGIADELA